MLSSLFFPGVLDTLAKLHYLVPKRDKYLSSNFTFTVKTYILYWQFHFILPAFYNFIQVSWMKTVLFLVLINFMVAKGEIWAINGHLFGTIPRLHSHSIRRNAEIRNWFGADKMWALMMATDHAELYSPFSFTSEDQLWRDNCLRHRRQEIITGYHSKSINMYLSVDVIDKVSAKRVVHFNGKRWTVVAFKLH